MAPGLYLGYRDQEYRTRDSDHEIFRKKDRSLDHSDRCRSNGKIVHDRVKGSRRESKGRGFIYRSHLQVKRSADREPCELSGEGIVFNHENDILVSGKRKFPPTLCDIQKTEQKRPRSDISFSCIGHEAQDLVDKAWLSDPAQEPERVGEDKEFVSTRNISSSRWADGNEGVDDEKSEVLDEGFLREGSEGSVSKQTCSSGDRNDTMDVDDEESSGSENDGASGSDSEVEAAVSSPLRNINMLQGCRDVDEFEKLNRINEGTYGVVFRARDKKSGEVVALKKVKLEKETEGFPLTALREINILLSFQHPSIVNVKEIVMGNLNSVFMVMEYMEHDLKGLMESMKQPFSQSEVKCLMLQLIAGVKYLHDNWVLHRDLKTSNILFNNRGELKICDFGLSRQYGSPLKPFTQLVVTLWYRAPELLLGTKEYSTAIDMWSLGCIMAELLAKEPLFSGNTEIDQLNKIVRTLGTPHEKIWPGLTKLPGIRANFTKQPYNKLREKFPPTSFTGRPTLSEAGFDLLNRLLTYDPEKRITAAEALNHAWFCEVPLPKSKDFMPTFPAQNSQDRRLRRDMKSPDPLEELGSKELQQGGVFTGQLFTSLISVRLCCRTLFCDGVDRKKPILFAALIVRSGILASYFFLYNELNETVQHLKIIVKECFTHQEFLLQYSKINGFSYFLHYYAFF